MMVNTLSSLSCSFCSSDSPSILGMLQPVHPRRVDVGDHQADAAARLQRGQGFQAVAREQEADGSVPYLVAEPLQDESLDVRPAIKILSTRRQTVLVQKLVDLSGPPRISFLE